VRANPSTRRAAQGISQAIDDFVARIITERRMASSDQRTPDFSAGLCKSSRAVATSASTPSCLRSPSRGAARDQERGRKNSTRSSRGDKELRRRAKAA